MKFSRQSYINTHRDSWVEINLEYLAENVKAFRKLAGNSKLLAVVKADAYGHGAVMTAPTMLASGVDMLGVASIDEGLNLRDANISCEILVLGAVPVWAFESVAKNDIMISIFSDEHIKACKNTYERCGKKVQAHIKIDTGMNRIGVNSDNIDNAVDFIKKVQKCEFIDLKGIFTHLAFVENKDVTNSQLNKFDEIISQIDTKNLDIHCLSTSGTINCENKYNLVRIGIGLYGLYPSKSDVGKIDLKQILSLKGRIVHIHETEANKGVSYSHTYKTIEKTKIATIPVGYADGVPRMLSNKIFAELKGKKIAQIGNITMDQMMFDITGIDAKEGDIVTLLDEELSIDNWAKILNTINYELTC